MARKKKPLKQYTARMECKVIKVVTVEAHDLEEAEAKAAAEGAVFEGRGDSHQTEWEEKWE